MPTPVNWSTEGTLLCEPEPLSLSAPLSPSSWDWLPSASPFFITSVALPPGTSFWKTSLKFFDTWVGENMAGRSIKLSHFRKMYVNVRQCAAKYYWLLGEKKCILYNTKMLPQSFKLLYCCIEFELEMCQYHLFLPDIKTDLKLHKLHFVNNGYFCC